MSQLEGTIAQLVVKEINTLIDAEPQRYAKSPLRCRGKLRKFIYALLAMPTHLRKTLSLRSEQVQPLVIHLQRTTHYSTDIHQVIHQSTKETCALKSESYISRLEEGGICVL